MRDSLISSADIQLILDRIVDEGITEAIELCKVVSRKEGLELTLQEARKLLNVHSN